MSAKRSRISDPADRQRRNQDDEQQCQIHQSPVELPSHEKVVFNDHVAWNGKSSDAGNYPKNLLRSQIYISGYACNAILIKSSTGITTVII